MTKDDAIRVFGSQTKLAAALGISPQAVFQWPETLTPRQANEVLGAAIRSGVAFEWFFKEFNVVPALPPGKVSCHRQKNHFSDCREC